jgi:GST-like protein
VLDRRLARRDFIVDEFSIADIACYPWIVPHAGHRRRIGDFPHLQRWFEAMSARPATRRTYAGVEDVYAKPGKPVATAAAPDIVAAWVALCARSARPYWIFPPLA